MSERDDALFDPTLPPDPELAALERALLPLRWQPRPFEPALLPPPRSPRLRPWLALAALLLVGVAVAWWWLPAMVPLQPDGAPRQFTAVEQPLTIPLGDLAEITLRPGSTLRFEHWRPAEARFALLRGSLEVRVQPPPKVAPGFFVVDTPLGRVVDMGCRYTLELRDDGSARAVVTEGAVAFVRGERTVFVPVGAAVEVRADGVRTPLFGDASEELMKAVVEYDLALTAPDPSRRGQTVKQVLAAVRDARDSLVLWHLLRDPAAMFREPAEQALLDLVGAPLPNTKAQSFDPEEWLAFLRLRAWPSNGK